jgi:flavorubredoxin
MSKLTMNYMTFTAIAHPEAPHKNLIGQAFGSYGWGGEAVQRIQEELLDMDVSLISEPINIKYVPTEESLAKCRVLGQNIAHNLKIKPKQ